MRRALGPLLPGAVLILCSAPVLGCSGGPDVNARARQAYEQGRSSEAATLRMPEGPQVVPEVVYTIGPRDVIEVAVLHLAEISEVETFRRRVGEDGTVTLPYVETVEAAGKTPAELRTHLEERYNAYIHEPFVDVSVQEPLSHRVRVAGAVHEPGVRLLPRDRVSLVEALSLAGGLETRHAGRYVYVSRGGGDEPPPMADPDAGDDPAADDPDVPEDAVRVDLGELLRGRGEANDIPVGPNDTIYVPRAEECFVTGYVKNPGPYPVRLRTTVLQAVGAAGGIRPEGSASVTRLVRRHPDGSQETVHLDLDRVAEGEAEDPVIAPGDVIEVGQTTGKWVWYGVLDFVKGLFGIGYSVPTG